MKFIAEIIELENLRQAASEIRAVGADAEGIKIMAPKAIYRAIRLKDVPVPASQILKEEMLSVGGEAARCKDAVNFKVQKTDVLLLGTLKHYKRLFNKLRVQPFGLKNLAKQIEATLKNYEATPPPITLSNGKRLKFGKKTLIMGILNMSPDSFSGDGLTNPNLIEAAIKKAKLIQSQGADIIDIGGESTRPGSDPVTPEEEIKRIVPAIKAISKDLAIPISVDTYKKEVAEKALKAGAHILNDITGFHHSSNMAKLAAEHGAPAIVMHIKGTPKNMQQNPQYESLMMEICSYLEESIEIGTNNGLSEQQIIIDPGIGFGKTVEHNLQIIKNLKMLKALGRPILVGASRKSFIGKILDKDIEERLYGTLSSIVISVMNGANIIRVHDVKEAREAIKLADAVRSVNG